MSSSWIAQMNEWGQSKVPFLFIIDFEMEKPIIRKITDDDGLLYNFNGFSNHPTTTQPIHSVQLDFKAVPYDDYVGKFNVVMDGLLYGNSFLCNLTFPTPVFCREILSELYACANAPYKLWKANEFLCFSPERFVTITNDVISTNPMKGTIDAGMPDAAQKIMTDRKEIAEHVTIVDLLRNDLSMVADNVSVNRFRYIDVIDTAKGSLLQVSSEISGRVFPKLSNRFGDIMAALLPAGSVSGAPKASTLEIIRKAEGGNRGYYTGVAGYYDGTTFDSCVMIRFIEQTPAGLTYRSGGGITTQSDPVAEYNEAISKIYVPVA